MRSLIFKQLLLGAKATLQSWRRPQQQNTDRPASNRQLIHTNETKLL
jgi:hypothetical protein